MTTLVDVFEQLLSATRSAFSQQRTFTHIRQLAYGFVSAWGRRTISRALCACHAQFEDWSASYRVFSRSPWEPTDLFQPVLETCLVQSSATGPFAIALDDTSLKKTGRRIPGVSYCRDPMSPAFHFNLRRGQRFIQASALLRPEGLNGPARSIPIRFHPAPPPPKPGKKADEAAHEAYRLAKKTQNLSCQAAGLIQEIRENINRSGYANRNILLAVDGSYCNKNVLNNLPDKVEVIARARGDINLFLPISDADIATKGRRRKYGPQLPKPKDIRTSDDYPWLQGRIFGAGRLHDLKYKVVSNVLWRSGTRTKPLKLIIIAPLRYRPTAKSKLLYRDPAYLLTTDFNTPVETQIQAYFDRWEIEVNHRDEKDLFGVGQAQVWSEKSAYRVPQFQVAIYSMLLLAALVAYGPKRTDNYLPQPKWRKKEERRPSTLDILALLREELLQLAVSNPPLPRIEIQSSGGTQTSCLKSMPSYRIIASSSGSQFHPTQQKSPVDIITAALYASS